MRLLFLSNVPSPYMVDFFNELGKLCDLTVVFEKKTSTERDKSWEDFKFLNFKGVILHGISTSVDSAFAPAVIKYLSRHEYDHIIITNPATPTGVFAILFLKLRRIPYILESEGSFAKSGKGLKERFKKFIMSGAKLYFSTTPKADEYFLTYGAPKDKLVKYPFTSLYKKDLLEKPLSKEDKLVLRNKLGLKGDKIAVAVGRFIPLKYYHVLIHAWRYLNKNYSLYLIGGGPERDNYENIIRKYKLNHVHLIDFMDKSKLLEYYKAADLFIHPTSTDVWGLVINEAMACGLPVITTDMCIAGLELINNDDNGYIVPVGNIMELAEKADKILRDEKLIKSMSYRSIAKISNYTFEDMAKIHFDILKDL
jgi:glycosyltransferase involved in cell wall biosynthesis